MIDIDRTITHTPRGAGVVPRRAGVSCPSVGIVGVLITGLVPILVIGAGVFGFPLLDGPCSARPGT